MHKLNTDALDNQINTSQDRLQLSSPQAKFELKTEGGSKEQSPAKNNELDMS